jgi:transposase
MAWRPMTDAEWAALSRCLRRGSGAPRGRRPADARGTWDGIFWVACSKGPWRDMPACFGRPDTAHRTLRRAAAAQRLHGMLLLVSDHPIAALGGLRAIEWFIVRTFRRAFRVTPFAIAYARRLGLASALPCDPFWLPKPHLSETIDAFCKIMRALTPHTPFWVIEALRFLHRMAAGDARKWRATG